MNQINMAVNIGGGLVIKNPVLTASGTFGYGEEYAEFVELNRLGALVVKGLSLKPRPGNPAPRIAETPAGMLNAIGLQNMGVRAFIKDRLPLLKACKSTIIANIYGETLDEFAKVAGQLSAAGGISALEVNISCPNVKKGGIVFGTNPRMAREVTQTVKGSTHLPVIVKLTPNVTDIKVIALAVEKGGADAISLINTVKGMAIDVDRRIPLIKNIIGGLSGPAIRPIALRLVWEVCRCVSLPVIGIGGIVSARDALEFLIAGARAVEIGTANFIDPRATIMVIEGIEDYLRQNRIKDINEVIGSLRIA